MIAGPLGSFMSVHLPIGIMKVHVVRAYEEFAMNGRCQKYIKRPPPLRRIAVKREVAFVMSVISLERLPLVVATWALFTWAGFVDGQVSAVYFAAIEAFDSFGCFVVIGHFYESKTLGATGVSVLDDLGAGDSSVFSEYLLKIVIVESIRQVSYIYVHLLFLVSAMFY